ncbi:replication-associated recombination protein A [Helicobacter hepaticus]|uniref:Replication-associated recombination protein A n=1 Tax=Helicobacter hepaticus (strain ATCC 51449 / 3B1) TaxID=235279 RepID=Q7VFN5_HELHP|nr:replication-associated recombination protein A [Helicobacter hepaticus]AAP78237.1 conserved hypothetical protein [Helicobacter hepaticus ATCC 51449]
MLNLAHLLRPTSLQDFIGQEHIIAPHTPLFKMLQHHTIAHCFFYGPPGSGKTTLAKLIAKELNKPFANFNATTFKIEELRKFIKNYEGGLYQPLIFIDEVHRLNTLQQEVLLPIMESHTAIIFGASTYNPFHSLTNAIRSRSFIFELKPLSPIHLEQILQYALTYLHNQKHLKVKLAPQAQEFIISSSAGDARAMLNLLDAACDTLNEKECLITYQALQSLRPYTLHDGSSEAQTHYSLISAMIKSIRGSDANASIYYLARLIAGGENPEFIARRLVILASEDIGNANPNALNLATSTMVAVSKIGYPESRIILSQCVIYLACSPKSNTAYNAINKALDSVKQGCILPIPKHIMPEAQKYLYPHDFGGWVEQNYLEDAKEPLEFVESTTKGFEKTLNEWLSKIKNIREKNE